jgi:hypothetical protein
MNFEIRVIVAAVLFRLYNPPAFMAQREIA